MDDFTAEILASSAHDESSSSSRRSRGGADDNDPSQESMTGSSQKHGRRSTFAALREKASLQDRLMEK